MASPPPGSLRTGPYWGGGGGGPTVADIRVEELLSHSCSCSDCHCKSNCREMTKAFACRRGCFEGRKMCIIGLVLHAVTHSSFWNKERQEFHCRKCGFHTPLVNLFMKHAYESPCQLVQTIHMVFMFAFFFMEDPSRAEFHWEMGEELWESMKPYFQRLEYGEEKNDDDEKNDEGEEPLGTKGSESVGTGKQSRLAHNIFHL